MYIYGERESIEKKTEGEVKDLGEVPQAALPAVYMYIYAHIYVYKHICIRICTYVYIHIEKKRCRLLWQGASNRLASYIHMCIYTHIYTHKYI